MRNKQWRGRVSWTTKLLIWRLCALGETDNWMYEEFKEHPGEYPADAPQTRKTIKEIRNQFASLEGAKLRQALEEVRVLEVLITDKQILALMAPLFCRPAFNTDFQNESNIPKFVQAIRDTIKALNTGIYSTREGEEIGRILPWRNLKDETTRNAVRRISEDLDSLIVKVESHLKAGEISEMTPKVQDYPLWSISPKAASDIGGLRSKIIGEFSRICPNYRLIALQDELCGE